MESVSRVYFPWIAVPLRQGDRATRSKIQHGNPAMTGDGERGEKVGETIGKRSRKVSTCKTVFPAVSGVRER